MAASASATYRATNTAARGGDHAASLGVLSAAAFQSYEAISPTPIMRSILTFDEAIKDSEQCTKRHLLLGNGFSIACRPQIFTYGSLFDRADFSSAERLRDVFESVGTTDFEHVIKLLEDASRVVPVYSTKTDIGKLMADDATTLKDILIQTVATNHPDVPNDISDSQFIACRKFLAHFLGDANKGKVYTLNYDLLLYWTLLQGNVDGPGDTIELAADDGFGRDEDTPDEYVDWMGESSAHYQRVHYLHGALHLFDGGAQLRKYTWKNTNKRLLEQARDAMNIGQFPLFVAEGTSEQKLAKIKHSAYLYHSYKSFSEQMRQRNDALFIFGHSLSDNDQHIMNKITQGKISHIYVGIYGKPSNNRQIRDSITKMSADRVSLHVRYFDAASAQVWGN